MDQQPPQPPGTKSKESSIFYKSKLCTHWQTKGMCAKQIHCNYAHGDQELRPIQPPEYMAHQPNQSAVSPFSLNNDMNTNTTNIIQTSIQGQLFNPFWKTKMCNFYLQGKCRNVIDCNYAHVEDELRDAEVQAQQSMQNLIQLQNPVYRLMLIHYNANFQKFLLERAKSIFEQIRQMQILHKANEQILDILEEAKLLVFQQEIEQATMKILDIMLKFEFNQDEREKHIEIKNKIKETFEQPQPQFQMNYAPTEQEISKVKELMEKEQGGVLPLPLPIYQIMHYMPMQIEE